MKTKDLEFVVNMNTCLEEARKAEPSSKWHHMVMRIAGIAYIKAQDVIKEGKQSSAAYSEAAKIIQTAMVAVEQHIERAQKVYEAKKKNHHFSKDERLTIVVAEQVHNLLKSYLGQLTALVESSSGKFVRDSVAQWINDINLAVNEKYIADTKKDWNAIFDGSSTALQYVSLDGYVYRYIKAINALHKMLNALRTDERVIENAADLNRLMERCQVAFADLVSARKTLVKMNTEDNKSESESK